MQTRERIKFQKQLVNELMNWQFESLGYSKDLKEMQIFNETYIYPFFAASSRGPFFTFTPSIRVKSKGLMDQINSITTYQILMNCSFAFGERLNRQMKTTNIRGYEQEENIRTYIGHSYNIRVNNSNEFDWTLDWFKHYIEKVCFPLVNHISTEIKLYEFLKKLFTRQIESQKGKDIRELMNSYELSIGHNEIITMIYLGFKHQQRNIDQLAVLAANYKEGPLYNKPIIELINYFEKK